MRFPSPLKSRFKSNNTVWGHLFLPRAERRAAKPACVLVLPVMAAPNVWIEERFMRRFVRDGLAVFWIEMPYQFHRRPAPLVPSGQAFLSRTAKGLAFNFRQSVLDARRALSWLSEGDYVDPGRIGVFGVSLGALVGSAVYSVDPAPKYAVFLLGGADFPDLVGNSSMTGAYVRRAGLVRGEMEKSWRGLDAADYRAANARKAALLVNAESDSVIPRLNALALHAAFPASRQIWVPFGHYTSIVHLLWLPGYVSRDFLAHL